MPPELQSLDTIHLATAQLIAADLARIVTYDERTSAGARPLGFSVSSSS